MVLQLEAYRHHRGSFQLSSNYNVQPGQRTTCVGTSRVFTGLMVAELYPEGAMMTCSPLREGAGTNAPHPLVFLLGCVAILERAGFLAQTQTSLPDPPMKVTLCRLAAAGW